ncbi:siderophore-interacting protein [Cedecea colo]|uniref:Siderophore-interacting protein n=1 Tax=Cedecea colo TaxID=2552946 RepID=A0ABX0VQ52_9ENTR|nr:siderophore-interacting protein [Cedecea colo]NIY48705.1 siderophore-interacting protein [Cedecea colo]
MTTSSMVPRYPRRVRNELRLRELSVLSAERIGDDFQRVVLGGEALEGFSSGGFADHCKLFFPPAGGKLTLPSVTAEGAVWPGGSKPASRDYTPLYNEQRRELTFDFYIHDSGLASDWAANTKPGDTLLVGGPRGSTIVPDSYHWQLYVCDESGMPALRRRLEALSLLSARPAVTALLSVKNEASKAYLAGLEGFNIEWFIGHSGHELDARLEQIAVPDDDYFIWITGEGKTAKSYARHFEKPQINPQLLQVSAYWHDKSAD